VRFVVVVVQVVEQERKGGCGKGYLKGGRSLHVFYLFTERQRKKGGNKQVC
jgi:hypothetical protein